MKKILIVDDSVLGRTICKRYLVAEGFEVVTANDGAAGLEAIESEGPDCLVLDLLMPVLDGFGVLQALQEAGSTLPVIVVSADIQDTTRQRVLELGAKQILHKPVDKETLVATIHEAIGGTSQEAA